jgi:hypothetical protein
VPAVKFLFCKNIVFYRHFGISISKIKSDELKAIYESLNEFNFLVMLALVPCISVPQVRHLLV